VGALPIISTALRDAEYLAAVPEALSAIVLSCNGPSGSNVIRARRRLLRACGDPVLGARFQCHQRQDGNVTRAQPRWTPMWRARRPTRGLIWTFYAKIPGSSRRRGCGMNAGCYGTYTA